MQLRTLVARTLAVAVAGAGIAFVATPAQAAEKPRHCVVDVSVASTPMTCYGSFRTAIAKATGGRVADAPEDAAKAMASARFLGQLDASNTKAEAKTAARPASAPRALADIVVSIERWDDDYEGATLTLLGTHECTGPTTDVDFWYPSLPSNWNDEIGSYRGFANCWVKHFEHINYAGISTAFDGGQNDMGWMDDETSSIQVS